MNTYLGETVDSLNGVSVNSDISLSYDSRENKSDIIYISMERWTYNPASETAIGSIKEYVKVEERYVPIGVSNFKFSKAEMNTTFTELNATVGPGDNFINSFEFFLKKLLLKEIKKTIDVDGKTIYGGLPTNWSNFVAV